MAPKRSYICLSLPYTLGSAVTMPRIAGPREVAKWVDAVALQGHGQSRNVTPAAFNREVVFGSQPSSAQAGSSS